MYPPSHFRNIHLKFSNKGFFIIKLCGSKLVLLVIFIAVKVNNASCKYFLKVRYML